MARTFRRIVTGDDERGQSRVVINDEAERRGITADLWFSISPLSGTSGADGADTGGKLEPPVGGNVFRFFVVPPEERTRHLPEAERERLYSEHFQSMSASHTRVDTRRHPGMHRTNTIDYVVLLAGSVTLLLDNDAVELEPFDVVVQRGTNHAWINHGTANALLVAVLIDPGEERTSIG